MQILLSLLLYVPQALFGFWLAHTIWKEPSPKGLWFKFFIGIPLGLGLWSLGFYLWIWAGFSRFIFPWIELAISLFFAFISIQILKPLYFSFSFRPLRSWLNLTCLIFIMVSAVLYIVRLYINPHGYEDAWFIWNLDSRFIYLAQDFRILYASGGPGWHPDYPLMVSLNIVSGWVVLGQDSPRIPMIVTTLFTFILPGILFSGLALLKDSKQAALATIVLVASPMVINYGVSQQADIPIAGFILASMLLVALFLKTGDVKLLILYGLFTGLTAWIKNEGYLFICINFFLLIVFLAFKKQLLSIKNYFFGGIFPLLVILLYKFSIPVGNDLFAQNDLLQLFDWDRYIFIFKNLLYYATLLGWWPFVSLLAVLLIYSIIVWFEIPDPIIFRFVGLVLLAQLAGYCVIYLLTPHNLVWHVDTSMERLLLQVFPAGLFLFFYITKSPEFDLLKE